MNVHKLSESSVTEEMKNTHQMCVNRNFYFSSSKPVLVTVMSNFSENVSSDKDKTTWKIPIQEPNACWSESLLDDFEAISVKT